MTLKQRGTSLQNPLARYALGGVLLTVVVIVLALLTACTAPAQVSDEVEGCPEDHIHVQIQANVRSASDGSKIDGRAFRLTIAAHSFDPEYGGILVEGVGITGTNPFDKGGTTDLDPADDPVLCIPYNKAVAGFVRISVQAHDKPFQPYEIVECELTEHGVMGTSVGFVPPVRLSFDQATIGIADITPATGDGWVVAQCDFQTFPPGHTGELPPLFPRPNQQ